MVHDTQVVGNEDIGQPQLFLKVLQQVQNLCLNRNIQGRDRLVADDQFGLNAQSAGYAYKYLRMRPLPDMP